ncbi:MAG: hypothetical protein MN733_11280 [Nitrososphaera sp.]|nr:hypothetical protein [Nitrososphaera sp.]
MLTLPLSQYDRKVVGLSLLFYFIVGTELSLIHHLGHNVVCAAEGYQFEIQFNPFGGYSTCFGKPDNFLLYSILGPALAAAAAGAPLSIPKIRQSRVWLIVLLALLSNEAIKIPIEAVVQMPSAIPALHLGMLLFQYCLLGSLVLIFARRDRIGPG